ncbi:hypothetical protein GJAV_G00131200 [Gymnothorax javanicus]|nr:hypothetical protein GJAV_G00131200 [Gymnothorax javanicus]
MRHIRLPVSFLLTQRPFYIYSLTLALHTDGIPADNCCIVDAAAILFLPSHIHSAQWVISCLMGLSRRLIWNSTGERCFIC